MSSKKTCKDALATFGAERQVKKCVEEMGELLVALLHYESGKDTIEHIAEELADVEIMLQQMILLFDCQALVDKYRGEKLASLRVKIAGEKTEEQEGMV